MRVAPFMGAWIETVRGVKTIVTTLVAPFMGAWIETQANKLMRQLLTKSLPLWERGLKLYSSMKSSDNLKSLPLWERGLKLESLI